MRRMDTLPLSIDLLQWPAMGCTVLASWLVASTGASRRRLGFWTFLLSNLLWVAWAVPTSAPALALLQVCLAAINIRGARKAARSARSQAPPSAADA